MQRLRCFTLFVGPQRRTIISVRIGIICELENSSSGLRLRLSFLVRILCFSLRLDLREKIINKRGLALLEGLLGVLELLLHFFKG